MGPALSLALRIPTLTIRSANLLVGINAPAYHGGGTVRGLALGGASLRSRL